MIQWCFIYKQRLCSFRCIDNEWSVLILLAANNEVVWGSLDASFWIIWNTSLKMRTSEPFQLVQRVRIIFFLLDFSLTIFSHDFVSSNLFLQKILPLFPHIIKTWHIQLSWWEISIFFYGRRNQIHPHFWGERGSFYHWKLKGLRS